MKSIEQSLKGFETFTLFLLISYFTTVTTRVWNMYCCNVAAMGRINDIVCLCRGCYEASELQDTEDGRIFLIDIHRFCSLSWVACFVGVTEAYTVDNLFRPFLSRSYYTWRNSFRLRFTFKKGVCRIAKRNLSE